jgi:ribonuclease HI
MHSEAHRGRDCVNIRGSGVCIYKHRGWKTQTDSGVCKMRYYIELAELYISTLFYYRWARGLRHTGTH